MEQILLQERYDDRPATAAAQSYMNRHIGITIAEFTFSPVAQKGKSIYSHEYPIRHAILLDENLMEIPIGWGQRRIYLSGNQQLKGDKYIVQYASGFGSYSQPLPDSVDSSFVRPLADYNKVDLPPDISLGIDQLQRLLDQRKNQRFDQTSMSGQLGSVSYPNPQYRMTIPSEIKGLFYNHRRIVV